MEPLPHKALPPEPSLPAVPAGEASAALSPDTVETPAPSLLKLASRKARVEEAERADAIAELRGAEIVRLEMLQDALQPVIADIPDDVEMFDMGIMPGERPRLFIDMIGFVEMGRDRRTYRFIQATRYGRVVIAESERMEPIISATVDYVARRLLEREKALAADTTLQQAARAYADHYRAAHHAAQPHAASRGANRLLRGFTVLTEFLGASVILGLLGLGVWHALHWLSAWTSSMPH